MFMIKLRAGYDWKVYSVQNFSISCLKVYLHVKKYKITSLLSILYRCGSLPLILKAKQTFRMSESEMIRKEMK